MNKQDGDGLLEDFLAQEYRPSVKTYYKSLLTGFQQYLNTINKDLNDFELHDVKDYYDKKIIGESWRKGSVDTFLYVIQSFCKWRNKELAEQLIGKRGEDFDRVQKKIVRLNRVIGMKKPRLVEKIKTTQPVDKESLLKIFRVMIKDEHNHNLRKYAFKRFWLLCWFGCRVGELVSIKPDMITLDDNKIHFITLKTIVERVNFYDDFTKNIIKEYLDRDYRLINISEQAYWGCLSRYTGMVGHRVYPKLGREAWNTNMQGVVDDNFVKVICGHSIKGLRDISEVYRVYPVSKIKDIMMKQHYLIPLEKELEELLDKYG